MEMHFSFVNKTTLDENGENLKVFDWSYVIGTGTGLLLIWVQTSYLKIYRFEATGIRWWFALPYLLFAGALAILLKFTRSTFEYFQYALVGSLTIFCTYFFF